MTYKVLLGHVKKSFRIIGRGSVITSETAWLTTIHIGDTLLLTLPEASEIEVTVQGIEHLYARPAPVNPYGLLLSNLPGNISFYQAQRCIKSQTTLHRLLNQQFSLRRYKSL